MQVEKVNQRGMIITDDFAVHPVLDFNEYADTIVDIIKDSYPKFSIGIYGEWGTGKTTLMRQIETKLKSLSDDNTVVTVWFNAWRYEREEQFALIPLLKKIAYSLPEGEKFEGLKGSIKKGIGVIRRNLAQIATSVVSDFVRQNVGADTASLVNDISEQLIPKIELLTEVNEKDTLYFDGLDNIEKEIETIRQKGQDVRIVVFVDDLDRCSPKKALEVFESVKVFMGVDGFVYVLGLSHETISKLITAEYGKSDSDIKGDQYIKKIIQIPISLPEWTPDDILSLIKEFIDKELLTDKYRKIIDSNRDLISKAVEKNPRELKRFINNYIVANEILSKNTDVNDKELLVVQSINVRWNGFYRVIIKSNEEFRKELQSYTDLGEQERIKEIDSDTSEKNFTIDYKRLLREFKSDIGMWKFLREHSGTIFGIKNWEKYRRATESVSEYATSSASKSETSKKIIYEEFLLFLRNLDDMEIAVNAAKVPVQKKMKEEYEIAKRTLDEAGAKIRHGINPDEKLVSDILKGLSLIKRPLPEVSQVAKDGGYPERDGKQVWIRVNYLWEVFRAGMQGYWDTTVDT